MVYMYIYIYICTCARSLRSWLSDASERDAGLPRECTVWHIPLLEGRRLNPRSLMKSPASKFGLMNHGGSASSSLFFGRLA